MSKILLVANTDWMLYNFRLPLARALRDSGHDVVLVAPMSRYQSELRENGFRCVDWPLDRGGLNPFRDAASTWALVQLYRREAPDVVHHFTIKANLCGSLAVRAIVRSRARAPICISTFTGLGFLFSTNAGARALRLVVEPLLRLALRGSRSCAVFQNEADLATIVGLGLVDPQRAYLVVSSGVDLGRFRPPGRTGNGRESSPIVVLMASRLLHDKGVGVFADATRILRDRGVAARFWLAGDPDPASPGSLTVKDLDRWQREGLLEWLGHRADMPDIFHKAGVAVLPSFYNEGVPRVLLEAAATGLPLVATDIEGCRVVVRPGVNGILVPTRDAVALSEAIERLVRDPQLRRRMGLESARIAAEEFDERKVLSEWLRLYDRLIREREEAPA
jgi:glycosyltransferase involved in cell wall biosynthesis